MAQHIFVTEIRTYSYEPDLTADVYVENEISNITEAMAFDRDDYLGGGLQLSEVADIVSVNSEWSIQEVEDAPTEEIVAVPEPS
jgi:hypothetical protein